jgi:hypothetical protein
MLTPHSADLESSPQPSTQSASSPFVTSSRSPSQTRKISSLHAFGPSSVHFESTPAIVVSHASESSISAVSSTSADVPEPSVSETPSKVASWWAAHRKDVVSGFRTVLEATGKVLEAFPVAGGAASLAIDGAKAVVDRFLVGDASS